MISVRARDVLHFLMIVTVALSMTGMVAAVYTTPLSGEPDFSGFATVASDFNLEVATNLPIWFQSMLLFCCSILMLIVTTLSSRSPKALYWLLLASIFLALSMDEACAFHDRIPLLGEMRKMPISSGTWMALTIALVAAAALYVRWVVSLPERIGLLVILAAALYAGGTLGTHAILGPVAVALGEESLAFRITANIGDLLEMAGLAVLAYALLRYIETEAGELRLVFTPGGCEPRSSGARRYPPVSPPPNCRTRRR